ncbi:MAG: SUMF1/EgtB/PvdO family nonheme iron enzyme [Caldilineaceae bacterium]
MGARLYNAVFQGDVRDALRGSLMKAGEEGLRLRLRLGDAPALLDLPWEYLYDPTLRRFFCHSVATPLVRYPEQPRPVTPLAVTLPLQVLVMIANPSDVSALNVEEEWRKVADALAPLEEQGQVQLTRLPNATLAALQRQLRRGAYHIFHFVGHGGVSPIHGERVLYLEDERGRARLVSGDVLGTLLNDHRSLRLALLNACEGARVGTNDPFAGVAQHLVLQGIPAIIAMQFEITDDAAILLAQEFYAALADGDAVEAALAEARKAIFVAGHEVEWGTPVLYSRASDGHLFIVTASAPAELVEAERTNSENLPGRGEGDQQKQEPAVAPSRQVEPTPVAPPPAQPRTPQAGEERTIRAAGIDITFVHVPAGPFQMGSNDYSDEQPIHTMQVEAFWLGKTPITNAQFRPFIESGGYTNQAFWTAAGWRWRTDNKITQPGYWTDSTWNTPQQPVVGVSWYEAVAYVHWLAQTTGEAIRLPTEAEWEKGARGSSTSSETAQKYPWGNDAPDKTRCNFNGNEGKTTPVGKYPAGASPYGALDMAGNVWEWTATQWIGNYENYANMVDNDQDGDAARALRGGSWFSDSFVVRSAYRRRLIPDYRNYSVGFRLVVFAPGG